MNTISYLFESFLKCPTKCYLRSVGEAASGNAYAEWVQTQNDTYRGKAIKRLIAELPEAEVVVAPPATEDLKSAKWRLALDLRVQAGDAETRLHAVERVPSEGRGKPSQFVPIRFVFSNKLTKDDRLLLAYDALILSEALGRDVSLGKIIHGDDHATLSVKIPGLMGEVRKIRSEIQALVASASAPDLILIRLCTECEFRDRCRQKAVEKDDLSLLGGVTEKERKRLKKKGIFTVTQLSYTFRPKRPRKRGSTRQDKYCPALKALAIREAKIHIIGSPELKLEGTPVYFDVEALPDRDFYYLIGAMLETPNGVEQRSFWADRIEDEAAIWADFLSLLAGLPNPILVHYGSFEAAFLKRMCSRYGDPSKDLASAAGAVEQPFNLLSFIFGHVYFPTYTNGLKDIGKFAGAKWQASNASGIQSLVWRYQWEETHSDDLKKQLLVYNRDDCQAVRLLTSELKQIPKTAESRRDVDYAYAPKRQATEQGTAIHGSFKAILASACADYDRRRIHIQKSQDDQPEASPRPPRTSPIKARDFGSKQGRRVSVPIKRRCRIDGQTLQPTDRLAQHTMIDLKFTKSGCKKVLTTFMGKLASCPICGLVYLPPSIQQLQQQIFGHGLMAWVAYQRVALRLPLGVISKAMFDLFALDLNVSSVSFLVSRMADEHEKTERLLWRQILRSSVIHVDETKINIRGTIQYAWVLTDGKHVVFRLMATRETHFLQELLAGYEGTLVSDFYPGYDSMPCRQQKCLVHLIRDLNDDLWKNPFNTEYEQFVGSVRDLLVPMLQDADKFGLKAWHLRKHQKAVEQFYRRTIDVPTPQCEITATYQKRFIHYRESLFTFLDGDEIPWHNNVAERAIRHFAVQRKISGYFFSKGATEYLRLLGIAQTCRFQNKSFLHFLLSGCKDVDMFKESKRRKAQSHFSRPEEEDVS